MTRLNLSVTGNVIGGVIAFVICLIISLATHAQFGHALLLSLAVGVVTFLISFAITRTIAASRRRKA